MNIGKRFDRMKQWTDERMGKEIKTAASDEFKALELEMQLRHEGMERLQRSMTTYVKSLSKTKEAEDKEKTLPIAYLGSTMASHGDDFEPDSEFGQCLSALGRANERIARMQESYVSNATNSWLESIERSLAQMKEYQTARKRLETRRLAYDTSMNKLQKAKKDDFALEESARAQKAKYDESSDDVQRRMLDIKEAEVDSINDLSTFLDAELAYYDRAREILMQCRRDWPAPSGNAGAGLAVPGGRSRVPRSRSNTGNSASFRQIDEDEPVHDFRPPIRARAPSGTNSPRRELPGFDLPTRPSARFEGPSSLNSRDPSPMSMPRLSRVPTDSSISLRQGLRPTKRNDSANSDVFGDQDDYTFDNDRYADERSASPASYSAAPSFSRSASWSQQDGGAKKLAPPPPPPSRAKKPPPPPPMKRSALSSSDVPRQY
ncbi:BAR-domain-containing protein, partial [Aureobasidium melanogenum]